MIYVFACLYISVYVFFCLSACMKIMLLISVALILHCRANHEKEKVLKK